MEFLQVLMAAIKAVPMLIDLTNRFIDMWIDAQVKEYKDIINADKKKLLYLKKTIREAKTDEERIALSIILADYHRGEMRQ